MAEDNKQNGQDQQQQPQTSLGLTLQYTNFNKGIVTEASPFNFPPDASRNEQNFVLTRQGTRVRRYGIVPESGSTGPLTSSVYGSGLSELQKQTAPCFLWRNAGNTAGDDFAVFVNGTNTVRLVKYDSNTQTFIPGGSAYTVTLTGPGFVPSKYDLDFAAAADGTLIIVGTHLFTTLVDWDPGTGMSTTVVKQKVRDFFGMYESTAVSDRPTGTKGAIESLSIAHRYNIRNQGWGIGKNRSGGADNYDLAEGFSNAATSGEFPSLADSPATFLKTGAEGTGDIWNITKFASTTFSGKAPNGHYIIDVFARGSSRQTEVQTEENKSAAPPPLFSVGLSDYDQFRPDSVAFFAGRAWYAMSESSPQSGDQNSPAMGNIILFSQVIENTESYEKCYQHNDPTHHTVNQLLATDGGFISIPEAVVIKKLVPFRDALLVFADNGVWSISGGDSAFTAENISVEKVTYKGLIAKLAVTVTEYGVFFAGYDDVYLLSHDGRSYKLDNLTISSIKSLYLEVGDDKKSQMTMGYDVIDKKVYLLRASKDLDDSVYKRRYDEALIFNIEQGGWTKFKWTNPYTDDNNLMYVTGILETQYTFNSSRVPTSVKFLCSWVSSGSPARFFCEFKESTFKDFKIDALLQAGTETEANLLTGYEMAEDSINEKRAVYLVINCKRTEQNFIDNGSGEAVLDNQSSCLFQARWGFTDNVNSNRWTTEREAYRFLRAYSGNIGDSFDYGQDVITTKHKIRGHGTALSLFFRTSPGKDLHLLSWAVTLVGG